MKIYLLLIHNMYQNLAESPLIVSFKNSSLTLHYTTTIGYIVAN